MPTAKLLTLAETRDRLRIAGMRIGNQTLANGIEQGVLPFGICIKTSGKPRRFVITERKLEDWIAQHVS